LFRALSQGTNEPACVELLGGLLTAVGEAAPLLHEKDESFHLDPFLRDLLQTQLSTETFPAADYFLLMMRRIRLERRLPLAWANNAVALNPYVHTIDLAKLRFLAEGVRPIDSAAFTIPVLRDRWHAEVELANSVSADSAADEFRNAYLDHEVAFGGLTLIDLTVPSSSKDAKPTLGPVVVAEWTPPKPEIPVLSLDAVPKPPPKVRVKAILAEKQYVAVSRVPKNHRILLRGRFWAIDKTGTELELRDALLFEDRDWSQGRIANPSTVALCSAAVNDLLGLGAPQPWTGLK
jgi:hypothetical protein